MLKRLKSSLRAVLLPAARWASITSMRIVARLSGSSQERMILARFRGIAKLGAGLSSQADREQVGQALVEALELHRAAEVLINHYSNAYYEGRHPKHHLWIEHNRFLYDECAPADRVLDIGCGGSAYQEWIAGKVRRFVAVDIDPARVEVAKRNHPHSPVEYRVMDVTKDLPAGEFDVAICSHVLEHLDDPVAFLARLAALVERIVIKVPLEDTHWIKLVRRDVGLPWLDDADHRREYTEVLLTQQLTTAGWTIDKMIRGYDLRATARRRAP